VLRRNACLRITSDATECQKTRCYQALLHHPSRHGKYLSNVRLETNPQLDSTIWDEGVGPGNRNRVLKYTGGGPSGQGKLSGAMEQYRQALVINPNCAEARVRAM
jgi:hypothetical protein